jgi:hypothetical protein
MNKFTLAALALALVLAASPAAKADDFNYTFTSESTTDTVYASGTLTGTEIGSTGVWQITSGSIDLTSNFLATTGSGVIAPGPWDGNDNLLTPGATGLTPLIDNGGMLFWIGGKFIDLYSIPLGVFAGPGTYSYGIVEEGTPAPTFAPSITPLSSSSLYGTQDELVIASSSSPSVTPEPPSVLLLATGLFALGFFALRKPRQSTAELSF